MRRLLTLIAIVVGIGFIASPAFALPAFVQNSAAFPQTANQQTETVTTGIVVAQGDLLVVVALRANAADTLNQVTDSKGNTYSVAEPCLSAALNESVCVASAYMVTALTNTDTVAIKWTNAAANNFWNAILSDYSGITTTSWLDKTAAATAFVAQATDAITSGATAATTQASELVFGMIMTETSGDVFTAGTGYTLRAQFSDANIATQVGVEDKIVSSTGAQTCTGTWVTGNRREASICATYKAAAGGGAATQNTLSTFGVGPGQ